MQPALPITIKKSVIGLLGILLVGTFLIGVLLVGGAIVHNQGNHTLSLVLFAVAAITVLLTLVQAYVYQLSQVELTEAGIKVVAWQTLFFSNVAITEWNQVQDVDVKKTSIFGQLFDYGTLLVQTAGTDRNLTLTYIPAVEQWRDYMATLADNAVQPVRNQ